MSYSWGVFRDPRVKCGSCNQQTATLAVQVDQGTDVEPDRWWLARCHNHACLADVPGREVWREPMSLAIAEYITGLLLAPLDVARYPIGVAL